MQTSHVQFLIPLSAAALSAPLRLVLQAQSEVGLALEFSSLRLLLRYGLALVVCETDKVLQQHWGIRDVTLRQGKAEKSIIAAG
jgi:hypothetical protein